MNILNKKAFTLVELIVVITILAILSTVAFISFQGYSVNSRDSVRITDMASIEKGLNIKLTMAEKIPVPDDKIDITASGTILTYQGYAGVSTLGNIGVNGGGKDPVDETYYTYSTNTGRSKYQLLGYLENGDNISFFQNTYADLTERYPRVRGDELGIIVNSINQEPVQGSGNNLDIVNTTDEYTVYIDSSDEGVLTGSGAELVKASSYNQTFSSCKDIIDTYGYGINSGIYNINPTGDEEFQVYCDMTTDNGGWTLALTAGGNDVIEVGTTTSYLSQKLVTQEMGAKLSDDIINQIYTTQFRTTSTSFPDEILYASLVGNNKWLYNYDWQKSEHIKTGKIYNEQGLYTFDQGLWVSESYGFSFNHWGQLDVWFNFRDSTRYYESPCCVLEPDIYLWVK